MFIALALAVATSPIQFKGGSPTDFVGAIADATQTNVMAVYSRHIHLDPMTIDIGNMSSTYTQINSKTPFNVLGGGQYLMHDKLYPEEFFVRLASQYVQSPKTNASNIEKIDTDKKITWDSRKQGDIKIGDLSKVGFTKPLTIYWLFRPMALSITAKNVPERKFLIDLSRDLGGTFVDSGNTYSIEPDWGSAYSRLDGTVSAMVARDKTVPERVKLDRNLWLGIFHDVGESYMQDFMASPNDQKTLEVGSDSPFGSTVYDFLVQLKNSNASNRQNTELDRYDSQYPVRVMISQDGSLTVEIPISTGRGRRAQYVRI